MKLKKYLRMHKMTGQDFARQHNLSVSSIYRYLHGVQPHFKRAVMIEEITSGMVTIKDLRGEEDE